MAYCVNCGKEYEEGEKFCTACGAPINGEVKSENENKSEIESESESKTFSPPVQNVDNSESVSFLSAKKYYILGAFVLAVIVGAFVYISSTPKESADVGMQKFCQAFINGDAEMLKKFEKDSELDKRSIKEKLMASKPNDVQDKFASDLMNAVSDKAFTNNNVSCRLIEQKGKEAKVEVTVDTYDFEVEYDVKDRMEKNFLNKPSFKFNEEELVKMYIETMLEVIGEVRPVKRSSFVVDCVYNSEIGVWKPKNFKNFEKQVARLSAPDIFDN